jgi:HAMP domain-containing protein
VVTDVANGNLKRKLVLETKGEIASLADTINGMIDTLAVFADQVSNVAREVGIEGKLGGQALVPGAAGIWRDLTDNVNQLAANLTTQVRAIADVATAVTKGDLTRSSTWPKQPARTRTRTGSRPTSPSSPECCKASAICSPCRSCCYPS